MNKNTPWKYVVHTWDPLHVVLRKRIVRWVKFGGLRVW